MSEKITKALIPAAGFGTRFLPITKAMPKEMMPLVDKSIIHRVVEELVEAGIKTIVIVTGGNKRNIEDYFDNNFELEELLERSGKYEELELVRDIANLAEFIYIRQKKGRMGNAIPVLNAKTIMGDDPFLVFWGDDFVDATPSRARQMIQAYEKYHSPIVCGVEAKNGDDFKKYAFFKGRPIEQNSWQVEQIIEKPGQRFAGLENISIVGGFIATSDIYPALEEAGKQLKASQELVYTLGLQQMIDQRLPVHAIRLTDAVYRDTGNKLEYMKAAVEAGLQHPDINGEFKKFLKELVKGF